MKHGLKLTLTCVLLLLTSAWANPVTYNLAGKITYSASALVGKWQGTNTSVSGQINYDAQASTISGQICLNLADWSTGEPLKDKHTKDMFQIDQFPQSCYTVTGVQGDVNAGQITLLGSLDIHGVKQDMSISGTVTQQNNMLVFDGNFDTTVTGWDMKRPTMLGMTVADNIQVMIHGEATPQ